MNSAGDDRLQRVLDNWREALAANGIPADAGGVPQPELERVFDASDFVASACTRDPSLLLGLADAGLLRHPRADGELGVALDDALADVGDIPALEAALRRFRLREMVRIVWRDLLGAPLAETLESLTQLADACIGRALERLYAWACDKDGVPRDAAGRAQQLVVLGMGKLGARELNLSSDIDLIFAYAEPGRTDGARALDNEQFFTRLGRQLIAVLGRHTVDGFVFRVDMRLRPFGDAGPLAMSFESMETYYQSQGRDWERYAMFKARVVAGDAAEGASLIAMLRPFIYRRYLDFGAIEAIRSMKRLIERELHKKGMDANIKLGPGGIREIEFIGQAFQLVRGGRDTDLQVRPILTVLERLAAKDLLPASTVRDLTEAYGFLRLTENRIQAWRDEQTHKLPSDASARERLARSMAYADWTGFAAALERHRARVHEQFREVFAAPHDETEPADLPLASVWSGSEAADRLAVRLQDAGYAEPARALERVEAFRDSAACRALSARGRGRLDRLMPLLLEAIGAAPDADVTLERLLRLLQAIVRRTAYLDLLIENPAVLQQLVRLGGRSPWIVDQLSRQPILLDELLDTRRLYSPLRRRELETELHLTLNQLDPVDLEQQMERLRQFAQGNMLRVAAADLADVIPLRVVSDYLTEIAEVVLARVTAIAWRHLVAKHGPPAGIPGDDCGFAVIGYGKLGGIELGYGSDLDLVFLHGSQDPTAMTGGVDGRGKIANEVFYARLGQRLVHLLATRTPSGILYETDMRLRPNGNAGMLVSSLKAFENYQEKDAWTWEHQALVRARPIVGDPAVMARFAAIRRHVLARQRDPEKLRADVVQMRAKMRSTLDQSSSTRFDLKQGVGGIADIEFMVQYAILRWAHQYPDLLDWTDNLRLLEGLARHDLLADSAAGLLADTYQVFRAVYHRNALSEVPGLIPDDQLVEERRTVRETWRLLMGAPD